MKRRLVIAASILLVLGLGWRFARACRPDFVTAVFRYHRHPDLPRGAFINGRLGVLQPTFARSYLVIAYRHLNGIGMSSGEREQARDYYKDRATGDWDRSGTDWYERWNETRDRIQSPAPPAAQPIAKGPMAYDPESHSFAVNCAEDAYRIALHTLTARRSRFGVSSAAFRSWLQAQDQVFANCDGGSPLIPPEASPNLPATIRADRDYQIAAAYFYARHYREAVERFRRIGQDVASPWSPIARYLVVRTLLRMTEDAKTATAAGAELTPEAERILADPTLLRIHGMTEFLAGAATEEARAELEKLATIKTPTEFLGGIVLAYAETRGADARVPEALHLVTRCGRYGWSEPDTWETTRAAFRMLHLRYPRSEWTKRTPTWFKE